MKKGVITLGLAVFVGLAIFFLFRDARNAQKFIVHAGTGDNVSGYAWSDNLGWISFNCTDASTCGSSGEKDYGVNIDKVTGYFSGYAWNEGADGYGASVPGAGWIYFGPDANIAGYGAVAASNAPETPKEWARYSTTTGQVTGWALVLSSGITSTSTYSWIKMSDDSNNYWKGMGVRISTSTSDYGDFYGWAWAKESDASSGIGWISFNCNQSSIGGSNDCGSSLEKSFKVHANLNSAPSATSLSYSNCVTTGVGCGTLNAYLSWAFNDSDAGSSEGGYQVVFNNTNSMTSPLFDTGQCNGAAGGSCSIANGVNKYPAHNVVSLAYGTTYYWWVKVWDELGLGSNWSSSSFTTPLHERPSVSFTYSPSHPSSGQELTLISAASYANSASPSTLQACDDAHCHYRWVFSQAVSYSSGYDGTASTTKIVYSNTGSLNASLEVTDNDGYQATSTETISYGSPLPKWKEVK